MKNNTSPYELNFSGLDLDLWNFTSLMLFLPDNQSLLTLNLSRNKFGDDHAKEISEMLKKNKKLRRLELEGNEFGPDSAKYFSEAVKINKHLRYLDLENNNLTNRGEDSDGIIALFESLKENTMLISLNLNNNYLTSTCGQYILSCLKKNEILIHLETFTNQRFEELSKDDPKHPRKDEHNKESLSKYVSFGLTIQQIKEIKEKIALNRKKYDEMRKDEWKERKTINFEENEKTIVENELSKNKLEMLNAIEEKKNIENFYIDKFKNYADEIEREFHKNVTEFFIETKTRLDKNRRRGGAKPKKK